MLVLAGCAVSDGAPGTPPDDDLAVGTEVSAATGPGAVIGRIDELTSDGPGPVRLTGWVCQIGVEQSLRVELYASAERGSPVLADKADKATEQAIRQRCRTSNTPHRFAITIPLETLQPHQGQALLVRVVKRDGQRARIPGGGGWVFPMAIPGGGPVRTGHPRVFTTGAEIARVVPLLQPGARWRSYFEGLEARVQAAVARSRDDWNASVVEGCDLYGYLYSFSYWGGDPATLQRYGLQYRVKVGNAAVTIAEAAYYSTLVHAGVMPGNAALSNSARDFARDLLLQWARRGFRKQDGSFRDRPSDFCGREAATPGGALMPVDDWHIRNEVSLQIGRGLWTAAHGYDLLLGLDVFSADQKQTLDRFYTNLFDLVARASSARAVRMTLDCNRFSNHSTIAATAMIATATVLGDDERFNHAFWGRPNIVENPFSRVIHENMYGVGEPLESCFSNVDDPTHSWQLPEAAPGEILDRYRRGPGALGYPMFALESLLAGAEVARGRGFDVYAAVGPYRESLERTLEYYAQYVNRFGYNGAVPAVESTTDPLPMQQQYVGSAIPGFDWGNFLLGSTRYESSPSLTAASQPVGGTSIHVVFAPKLR